MRRIAAMIMAAGEGRRFGGCKSLAQIDGIPLIQRVINRVGPLVNDTYVITGAWHSELSTAQQSGQLDNVTLLYNADWRDGIGRSIACGTRQLAADYDGILILLADQVAVTGPELQQLLEHYTGENIVCCFYNQRRGVPALFAPACYEWLSALRGDQGAKALLYQSDIPVIACPAPSAALDIDTREQLTEWQRQRREKIQEVQRESQG